jgi:SAM-dependent methyltransferase
MISEKIDWLQKITFPNGEVTPGRWMPFFEEYGLTKLNFKGKRVLDVGCLNGLYTFYVESRGAKVVSIDIVTREKQQGHFQGKFTCRGYLYAHKQFRSAAKYVFPCSVYDLSQEKFGKFDTVLFLGVIYHLAHPLLALEKINRVLKKNGVMVMESEVSPSFSKFYHTTRSQFKQLNPSIKNSPCISLKSGLNHFFSKSLVEKIDWLKNFFFSNKERILWKALEPLVVSPQSIYRNDPSNLWIIDSSSLEGMVDFAGFKIERKLLNPVSPNRVSYVCKKIKEFSRVYGAESFYTYSGKRMTNMPNFASVTKK